MITKYPDLRDFLQGFKAEALSREALAPTPTTAANTTTPTTIGTSLEDSLLFITGGHSGSDSGDSNYYSSYLTSTEVYPSSSGCSPPPLPLDRYEHTTFMTSEPTPLVGACGGSTLRGSSASCLVLDPINQRWDE